MRCEYLLLSCLVLSIGCSLTPVSAEKNVIVVARSVGTPPTPKPTAAPLHTSTPRPPLEKARPTAAPTKAPVIIVNEPPKLTATTAKKDSIGEKITEAVPLQTPPTNASFSQTEESLPKQATPLQVTGFITKNGNIYEVTDKNGVGQIESRQSPESDKAEHVCNYGNVVIYSDVPCNEVTNVRIGDVQHEVVNTAHRDQDQQVESQQPTKVGEPAAADNNNNSNNNAAADSNANSNENDIGNANANVDDNDDGFDDFDDIVQPVKKRRRNKNPNKQRRGNGNRYRPNGVRQGGSNRHRQQAQRRRSQESRPRQQSNRYTNQQQRKRLQQKRRRNQNGNRNGQRKRGQSSNRRRYNDYEYEY